MDDLLGEFVEESTESIFLLDNQLIDLEKDPNNKEILKSVFRLLHTIKGTCGFIGLSRLEKVAHAGEAVLVSLRDEKIFANAAIVTLILECIDAVKYILLSISESGHEPDGDDEPLIVRLLEVANDESPHSPSPDALKTNESELVSADSTQIEEDFFTMDFESAPLDSVEEDLNLAEKESTSKKSDFPDESATDDEIFDFYLNKAKEEELQCQESEEQIQDTPDDSAISTALGADVLLAPDENKINSTEKQKDEEKSDIKEELPKVNAVSLDEDKVIKAQDEITEPKKEQSSENAMANSNIRVNIKILENLMSQVSELVLTRNQILETFKEYESTEIRACLHRLDQITSELREGITKTRMQPIGNAWTKLPRLIRDLAIDTSKKVDLVMLGAETELDKQVIELIKDPLMHMLRNSVDHGLESPSERAKAGKSETGVITLNAYHQGGIIVIEVSDDGKGLSLDRIKQKAITNGLTTPQMVSSMTDAEIYQFIFKPGFSTAEAVTNVSGRGVGMDVVRSNVEKINGTIDVQSFSGSGTLFTIKIPLTLAIVSALLVEAGGHRFALPQLNIQELIKVSETSESSIEFISEKPLLRLRDELVPLVRLTDLLHLENNKNINELEAINSDSIYIAIIQASNKRIGVVIDQIYETQEIVVKPVPSVLRHLTLYSGNTILGDGNIVMILDPNAIASLMGNSFLSEDVSYLNRSTKAIDASMRKDVFMVFRAEEDSIPIAIPLFEITRVETIDMTAIESFDEHPLMQYHNVLIPLVILDKNVRGSEDTTKPLLILTHENQMIGLVVHSIDDIFENEKEVGINLNLPGRNSIVVLNNIATDVVDTLYYFNKTFAVFGSQQNNLAYKL